MTTTISIHSASTPPTQLILEEAEGTVGEFPAQRPEQTRQGASPAGIVRRSPSRWNLERERPEDDEAVITAVPATVTHRSVRERPEDDEVVLTYTSEPACRHVG